MNTINNQGDPKEVISAVLEWTKQITTLATGTLVLSATFITDILKGKIEYECILITSWILFALSALLGILVMGNVCYLFSSRNKETPSIYDGTTRLIANLHFFTFSFGLIGFVFFASVNFLHRDSELILSHTPPNYAKEPAMIQPSQSDKNNPPSR